MRGGDINPARYQARSSVEAFNIFGVLHCDGKRLEHAPHTLFREIGLLLS